MLPASVPPRQRNGQCWQWKQTTPFVLLSEVLLAPVTNLPTPEQAMSLPGLAGARNWLLRSVTNVSMSSSTCTVGPLHEPSVLLTIHVLWSPGATRMAAL